MYSLDVETGIADLGAVGREHVEAVLAEGTVPIVWQPIVSLSTREVLGYEALARFVPLNGQQLSPAAWFAAASAHGLRQALELAAVRSACSELKNMPDGVFISLNISPATLAHADFLDALGEVEPSRLILEIAEDAVVDASEDVQAALSLLRESGVRVALDDTGSGLVSLRQLLDIQADIIKIDTDVVRGIDVDITNQAIAFSLKSLAERSGALSLAEGVETEEEAKILADLGIQAAQGYLFGRPESLTAAAASRARNGTVHAEGAGGATSAGTRRNGRKPSQRRSPQQPRA